MREPPQHRQLGRDPSLGQPPLGTWYQACGLLFQGLHGPCLVTGPWPKKGYGKDVRRQLADILSVPASGPRRASKNGTANQSHERGADAATPLQPTRPGRSEREAHKSSRRTANTPRKPHQPSPRHLRRQVQEHLSQVMKLVQALSEVMCPSATRKSEQLRMPYFVEGERHIRHDLGSPPGAFQLCLRRCLKNSQQMAKRNLFDEKPARHCASCWTHDYFRKCTHTQSLT